MHETATAVRSQQLGLRRVGIVPISWLSAGLTLMAALAVRCVGLDHVPGINGDEAQYGVHALSWLDGAPLSSLRTGTNLPMNPPFFGVVVMLHALLGPSLHTLRLSALLHSLLTLVLIGVLFRRRGRDFVAFFVLIAAVLPIHLGYARFAWDSTAVPTLLVLGVAAATALRPWLTAVAFAFALWVHPLTFFSLPLLAAPFVAQRWPASADGQRSRPSIRACVWLVLGLLVLALTAWLLVRLEALPAPVLVALHSELATSAIERLLSPSQALTFLRLYASLLCGPTIYRYIAGSMPDGAAWLHLSVFVGLVASLLWVAIPKLRAAQRTTDLSLMVGILASLVLAYVVVGATLLEPNTERYGMFLTVPSCYAIASCLSQLSDTPRRAAWLRMAVAGLGACLLLSFSTNYLAALRHADPARHNTFRTGDVEPKQRALQALLDMRDAQRTTVVLTEDWWIYWSIRYLAHRQPNLRVTIAGTPWDYRFPRDFVLPAFEHDRMELCGIAWAGSPVDQRMRRNALQQVSVHGAEPNAILNVYRLRPPP